MTHQQTIQAMKDRLESYESEFSDLNKIPEDDMTTEQLQQYYVLDWSIRSLKESIDRGE